MTVFDKPAPHDYVYLRIAGTREIHSAPLIELLVAVSDATYDHKLSTPDIITLTERRPNGKVYKINKKDLINKIQADAYGDKIKIADLVIQPEGEMQTPEVTAFLEKQ